MIISELEDITVFRHLDVKVLEDISSFCTKMEIEDGVVLISENDVQPFDLFVLCKGRLEILSNGSGITSGEVTLSHQEKEIFGEISWLTGRKRSATIRSHGAAEVVRIDGQRLKDFLNERPAVGFVVMQAVAMILADSVSHTDQLLKQILWNSLI